MSWLSTGHAKLATGLLLLQAVAYYGLARTEIVPDTPAWTGFPAVVGEWSTLRDHPVSPEVLAQLKPDDFLDRVYVDANQTRSVNFSVAYFKTRRTGNAPHSPKACLPGAGWNAISSEEMELAVGPAGAKIPVNLYQIEKGGARMLMLYWYQQNRHAFTSEIVAQLYAVPELLSHGRTDIALVRVIVGVPPAGGQEAAKALAMDFARQTYPLILRHIP